MNWQNNRGESEDIQQLVPLLKDTFSFLQTKPQLRLRQKPRKFAPKGEMPHMFGHFFCLLPCRSLTARPWKMGGWLQVARLLFYWVMVTFSGANSLFNFRGVLKKTSDELERLQPVLSHKEFGQLSPEYHHNWLFSWVTFVKGSPMSQHLVSIYMKPMGGYIISHRIHVWYIHLHLGDLYSKCR